MRRSGSSAKRGEIEIRRCFDPLSRTVVDREYIVDGYLSTPVQQTPDVSTAALWRESLVRDFLRLVPLQSLMVSQEKKRAAAIDGLGFELSPNEHMIFDPELACDLIREELTERVEKATELDGPIPYGISAANVLAAKSPHSIEHFSAMLAESIRMLMVEINKVQTLVDQVRLLKDYVEREAQPDHVLIYDEIRTDQFCTGELMKDILRLASAFHLYLMRTSGANEEAKEGKRVVAVRRRGVEQAAKKKKAQGDESRSRLAKPTIDLWRQKPILVNRPHPTARAVETLIKAANRKKAESRSDLEKMAARLGIGRARIRDIISQEMVPTGLIGRQLRLS